jgi:hypothetical protein
MRPGILPSRNTSGMLSMWSIVVLLLRPVVLDSHLPMVGRSIVEGRLISELHLMDRSCHITTDSFDCRKWAGRRPLELHLLLVLLLLGG